MVHAVLIDQPICSSRQVEGNMRINARLNDEWEEKLRFISQQKRINQTDIIKKALDLLYQQVKSETIASVNVQSPRHFE